ncbi:MAG TPA: DnaJ C-terminal domain-containing protein [Solirubrobacteraceae bacterium]|jgi:curved DNA-binding protein|nr:DnaJ C-terminal domain-containing protein [Solirubrobacteraceae bacterium]
MSVASEDFYEALGVPRDASQEDIRRAYRALARRYHPDVNKEPGAEDRFKEISEAYEVLRDPEKRARYDRFGARSSAGVGDGDAGGFGGFDGGEGFEGVSFDVGGGDFSDLFDELFSRRRGGRRSSPFEGFSMRGSDLEVILELGLSEAAAGGKRRLSINGRSVEIDIPAGVRDGQVIRLPGEGAPGPGDGPPGELILRIRLRPHPTFRVEGGDLYTDLPVAPWEAALGAEVPVPTLDGTARVKVPAGSSCGRRLRLRGQGLPGNAEASPGDLYAIVQIQVPKRLTSRERGLFQKLAETSKFNPRSKR